MEIEEDAIIRQCREGLLPKLPFLIEERDITFFKKFFSAPTNHQNEESESTHVSKKQSTPLSLLERKSILTHVQEKVKTDKDWWTNLNPKSRAHVILFLSESFDGSKVWSSAENAKLVDEICYELTPPEESIQVGSCRDAQTCLSLWFTKNLQECTTPSKSDFHAVLQIVKGKFNKSGWKYFPASVHGFGWILKQITHPFLGFEIDMIIPPALLFTDDYYDEYKILGLECLSHIVKNVDKVDLSRSNWANVVFDAVEGLCSDKDPVVIELVMPILVKLLKIIEKDPAQHSSQFTRYDDLIKKIIFQMEINTDLTLKRTWFPILNDLLKIMGIASLHWSDRICEMLRDSTVCNDFSVWNNILQVTATLIKNTWVKVDGESISEIVLRILLNLSTFHATSLTDVQKEEVIGNATVCFKLLKNCEGFEEIDKEVLKIVNSNDSDCNLLHPDFISVVKKLRLKGLDDSVDD